MLVYPNQILQHQTHQKKAHSKQNIFLIWTAPTACLTQNPYKARLWSTSPLFNCNPRSDKRIAGSHKIFIVHLYKQLIFSIKKKKKESGTQVCENNLLFHLILLGMLLEKVITHTSGLSDYNMHSQFAQKSNLIKMINHTTQHVSTLNWFGNIWLSLALVNHLLMTKMQLENRQLRPLFT